MKAFLAIFAVCVVILLLVALSTSVGNSEVRKRAELQMLDWVRSIASDQIEVSGQTPTNWNNLSNSAQWPKLISFCGDFIPSPTESYVVLNRPVFFNDYARTGAIFIVRAKACKEWGREGRWALLRGTRVGNSYYVEETNVVFRVWLPEDRLSSKIRSQLENSNAPAAK